MFLNYEEMQDRDEYSRDTDATNGMNCISVLKVSCGDSPQTPIRGRGAQRNFGSASSPPPKA